MKRGGDGPTRVAGRRDQYRQGAAGPMRLALQAGSQEPGTEVLEGRGRPVKQLEDRDTLPGGDQALQRCREVEGVVDDPGELAGELVPGKERREQALGHRSKRVRAIEVGDLEDGQALRHIQPAVGRDPLANRLGERRGQAGITRTGKQHQLATTLAPSVSIVEIQLSLLRLCSAKASTIVLRMPSA